jgi:hypothetical protein
MRGGVRATLGPVSGEVCAQPKHEPYRNEALRLAYRMIPCQWDGCGVEDGTVCCAHSNLLRHGKARGQKADDNRAAALCFVHHQMLDQGHTMSKQEREDAFMFAHKRTLRTLVGCNLWPLDAPLPEDVLHQSLGKWFRNLIVDRGYELVP